MKKQKFKVLLKLGVLLFGISLFIVACQKDDDFSKPATVHSESNNSNLIVKPVSFKELKKNKLVFEKIIDAKSKLGISNKIVNDSINNFSINTDTGIYIEDGINHSYTFEIERPNNGNYLLENLVLNKKDSSYQTILYQYNITPQELDLIQQRLYVNLEGKIDRTVLENTTIADDILGKYYFDGQCWEDGIVYVDGNMCPEGLHDLAYILNHMEYPSQQCIYYLSGSYTATAGYWTTTSVVVGCDYGGSSNNNTNSNPNGTNNNHGNPTGNTVHSTPNTFCSRCPTLTDPIDASSQTPDEKNCEELQKLLETPTYPIPAPKKSTKNALIDLQGKLGHWNEQGYSFSHNLALNNFANPVENINSAQLDYPAHPAVYGGAHTHPDNTNSLIKSPIIPMLSHGDIYGLFQFTEHYNHPNNQNPDSSLFVHILVSSQGTYAIKINDFVKFQAIQAIYADEGDANDDGTDEKWDFEYNLNRRLKRFYNWQTNSLNGTPSQYQKIFLEFISDYDNNGGDLGISLYKVNPELDTWEKLEIDTNEDNDIKETPCN